MLVCVWIIKLIPLVAPQHCCQVHPSWNQLASVWEVRNFPKYRAESGPWSMHFSKPNTYGKKTRQWHFQGLILYSITYSASIYTDMQEYIYTKGLSECLWRWTQILPSYWTHLYSLELKRFLGLVVMLDYSGYRRKCSLSTALKPQLYSQLLPVKLCRWEIKSDCIPNTAIQLNTFIQQNIILPYSTNQCKLSSQ